MKKIISSLLAFVMLFSTFSVVLAASGDITLEHRLTCNGETLYTAEPGEVITVTLDITNKTADEGFTAKNLQSEIFYDTEFFEYVGEITIDESSANPNWSTQENLHYGERRVCLLLISDINAMLQCENSQTIAAFKLKVKEDVADNAQGTVKCRMDDVYVFGADFNAYAETAVPLTVVIGGEETPESYTITYMNDGEVFETADATPKVVIANAPSKEGKRFLGWKDESGALRQPGEEYTATADTTFTAEWGDLLPPSQYTLTFETNGGSEIAPITKTSGTVIDLSVYLPTREGYVFEGWYSDETLENKVTSVIADANKSVYAKWSEEAKEPEDDTDDRRPTSGGGGIVKYTVSFESDGGTELDEVDKTRNTTVDLSKYIPEKDGYTFGGWYTDKELTNKVDEIKVTKDITLYAKWIEGEAESENKPNYKPDIMTDEHYAYIMGREEGMIYPEANLTRAEAATIFFRLLDEEVRNEAMTKENKFSDVNSGDWFNTAVSTLANLEILKGRTVTEFAPEEPITRAELTTIVARLSEASYSGEDLFADIYGHWAQNYINIAANIGWIIGENGYFRPDDNITRAEVMTLVNRMLNRQPETKEDLLSGMAEWNDSNEDAWYYLAVQEATNSHNYVMKEDGIHEKWTELTESPEWTELEK